MHTKKWNSGPWGVCWPGFAGWWGLPPGLGVLPVLSQLGESIGAWTVMRLTAGSCVWLGLSVRMKAARVSDHACHHALFQSMLLQAQIRACTAWRGFVSHPCENWSSQANCGNGECTTCVEVSVDFTGKMNGTSNHWRQIQHRACPDLDPDEAVCRWSWCTVFFLISSGGGGVSHVKCLKNAGANLGPHVCHSVPIPHWIM